MKTSNKILATGVLLVLATLVMHDLQLRGEYKTKRFLDPYADYTTLALSNFDEVAVTGGKWITVKIEQGPYSVKIANNDSEVVRIYQTGNKLQIDITLPDKGEKDNYKRPYTAYISCPTLRKASFNSIKHTGRDSMLVQGAVKPWYWKSTIHGFTQDSLYIEQDNATSLELDSNRIGYLTAQEGNTKGSAPRIQIAGNNKITEAHLWLRNYSKTEILGKSIATPTTIMGDSATITYRGTAGNEVDED